MLGLHHSISVKNKGQKIVLKIAYDIWLNITFLPFKKLNYMETKNCQFEMEWKFNVAILKKNK